MNFFAFYEILEACTDTSQLGITVRFSSTSYIADETGGNLSVCIMMLNGNLQSNVTVMIASVDGTASGKGVVSDFYKLRL